MIASFFGRSSRAQLPLPPLDPPPSSEKRLEKEKAWLASISSGGSKRQPPPKYAAPVENIARSTSEPNGLLSPDRKSGRHSRQSTGESTKSSGGSSSINAAASSPSFWKRSGNPTKSFRSDVQSTKAPQTPTRARVNVSQAQIVPSASFVHVPLPSPSSHLAQPGPGFPFATAQTASTGQGSNDQTKSLAKRLEELEAANQNGLLGDEEYRVLKRNLFEKTISPRNEAPEMPTEQEWKAATKPEISTDRTGELLRLPRLAQKQQLVIVDARPPEASASTSAHLLPPSSDSIRSKSGRLSLRSSKSALTMRSSRLSSMFRRSASTPAGEAVEVHETGSVASMPFSVTSAVSGKKKTSKRALPDDWKELQALHQKELSREAQKGLAKSGQIELGEETSAQPDTQYRIMRDRAGSRTTRGSDDGAFGSAVPASRSDTALSEYLQVGSGLPAIPSPSLELDSDSMPYSAPMKAVRARSNSRMTRSSRAASVTSTLPGVHQPSDEILGADGLRAAILNAKAELAKFEGEFEELEMAALAKSGTSTLPMRRGSAMTASSGLSPAEERRRISMSSSSGYASSAGGGLAQSRISIASPPPSISRRPSRASSIASAKSASAHQDSYFRPVSVLMEEQEDLDFAALPSGLDKEVRELSERRMDLQQRYKARIGYLEARLQAELIKEKLRR